MQTTPRPTHDTDDDRDRDRTQQRYEQLLATVEQNTGGPGTQQRAGLRRCEAHLILAAHGPYDVEEVEQSIRAALSAELGSPDLVAYRDEDGVQRLARRTTGGLQAIVGEQNGRADPNVELQKWAARVIEEVDDE